MASFAPSARSTTTTVAGALALGIAILYGPGALRNYNETSAYRTALSQHYSMEEADKLREQGISSEFARGVASLVGKRPEVNYWHVNQTAKTLKCLEGYVGSIEKAASLKSTLEKIGKTPGLGDLCRAAWVGEEYIKGMLSAGITYDSDSPLWAFEHLHKAEVGADYAKMVVDSGFAADYRSIIELKKADAKKDLVNLAAKLKLNVYDVVSFARENTDLQTVEQLSPYYSGTEITRMKKNGTENALAITTAKLGNLKHPKPYQIRSDVLSTISKLSRPETTKLLQDIVDSGVPLGTYGVDLADLTDAISKIGLTIGYVNEMASVSSEFSLQNIVNFRLVNATKADIETLARTVDDQSAFPEMVKKGVVQYAAELFKASGSSQKVYGKTAIGLKERNIPSDYAGKLLKLSQGVDGISTLYGRGASVEWAGAIYAAMGRITRVEGREDKGYLFDNTLIKMWDLGITSENIDKVFALPEMQWFLERMKKWDSGASVGGFNPRYELAIHLHDLHHKGTLTKLGIPKR